MDANTCEWFAAELSWVSEVIYPPVNTHTTHAAVHHLINNLRFRLFCFMFTQTSFLSRDQPGHWSEDEGVRVWCQTPEMFVSDGRKNISLLHVRDWWRVIFDYIISCSSASCHILHLNTKYFCSTDHSSLLPWPQTSHDIDTGAWSGLLVFTDNRCWSYIVLWSSHIRLMIKPIIIIRFSALIHYLHLSALHQLTISLD